MIWKFITYFVRKLNPETAHKISLLSLKIGFSPKLNLIVLPTTIKSINFSNPLGLAAGFDKNAAVIKGVHHLNFGFMEVGTITPLPQYGNPKPRVFRLNEDQAIINRNGFNNIGMIEARKNLVEYRKKNPVGGKFIVGINIGPNKNISDRVNDYKLLSQELSQFADYISINISSPNTPNLRDFHEAKQLKKVIDAVKNGLVNSNKNNIQVPIFLKIAPDIDDISLDQIIKTAHLQNLSALIISNTTIERHSSLQSKNIYEIGGLSGKPLFMKSTNLLSKANQIIKAKNYSLQLVAAGGVSDHYTAYAKILSGANLVQLYTAMTYSGPMIGDNIINGIISLMKRDKVSDLKNIRGIASDENIAIKMAKNGIQTV